MVYAAPGIADQFPKVVIHVSILLCCRVRSLHSILTKEEAAHGCSLKGLPSPLRYPQLGVRAKHGT